MGKPIQHSRRTGSDPPVGPEAPRRAARVAIYAHDTYGLGHLCRCLKIAKALRAAYPEVSVLLITGSPYAGRYAFPQGVDFVKLPSVVKTDADTYEPRSLGATFPEILELRQNMIFEAVKTFDPQLFLVDHSPLGMKGEIRKTLEWLKKERSDCQLVLGLRDIVDEPQKVIDSWSADGVYDALDRVYDQIWVYGTPSVFEPVQSYRFGAVAKAKTRYAGFICNPPEEPVSVGDVGSCNKTKQVFLTVGGGEDGGGIVEAFLDMLSEHKGEVEFQTTIVTGPFFPQPMKHRHALQAEALGVDFHEFLPDLSRHLRRADLVVSMGGYNTITEILSHAKRALVIPRTHPRKEQLIRAQRLSEMGLIDFVLPEALAPEALFETVASLLDTSELPLEAARESALLPLDGGEQVAAMCQPFLQSRAAVKR